MAAAQAKHQAGAPDTALELLATAKAGPLDELGRAQVELLGPRSRSRCVAAATLRHCCSGPPSVSSRSTQGCARDTYLDAFAAATSPAVWPAAAVCVEVAQGALTAPPSLQPALAADLLLDGLALRITQGYGAGAPVLREALSAFRSERIPSEEALRCFWLACYVAATDLRDDEIWDVLSARQVQLARDAGALTELPIALATRIALLLLAGELAAAASLVEEAGGDHRGNGELPRALRRPIARRLVRPRSRNLQA